MSGFVSSCLKSALTRPHSFRRFGPLRYARLTMDHEMGRSRGTGFVCFWSVEDADKVVEKSDLVHRETSESTTMVLLALHLEYVLAVLIHVDSGQA